MSAELDAMQVGVVEVLRRRVYPLDQAAGHMDIATTVVVEPGRYPLYRDQDAYFWMLSGRLNSRGGRKIGDGLFVLGDSDVGYGPVVTFPSRFYGPDQFEEFLADSMCTEGDPQQRLRFTVDATGGAS